MLSYNWCIRVASLGLLVATIVAANEDVIMKADSLVNIESGDPLIATLTHNITCEVANGKQLPSTASVWYSDCGSNESFQLPTVSRNQKAVTARLDPEWLQRNGVHHLFLYLSCCGFDSITEEPVDSIYPICAPLNAPNVSLEHLVGIEQNTLLIQVYPSTDSQKDILSCDNAAVEREITVRYTLANGNTITDKCTTTNSCNFKTLFQLDTKVQVEVNVTDSHVHVSENDVRKRMQTASSQSKALIGELTILRPLETFTCATTASRSGSLDFSWQDTRLSTVRNVQVTSWVNCDCQLLSASGKTVPAGHYNASVVNLAGESATLRLAVASGAACECTLKRKFGESTFASDDQKVSCESSDDYTSVEPSVVLGMRRQEVDSKYQVLGVHIQQPTIEQLNGVAVNTRLRLFELVNSTGKSLYWDLVVSSNKTYFQLPDLLASKSYLLQVQVATRRGYNDKNEPTELVIKGRNNQDEQPAVQCTNAVIVNTDLKALEFRVRCTEGDNVSLKGKRFRFVLRALACLRVSMNSQDCSKTMLVATETLRNASFSELNQAVVRMSLASNEGTLMLYNSIKSSLQNEMILMGESISVADEESGDWLLTKSLMELKCAYYSNEPVTELDLSTDGTNSRIAVKLSRCSSLAYGKRGLVNQLQVVGREVTSSKRQNFGSIAVPFASDSDVDLNLPLEVLSTDVTYELTVKCSSFHEGSSRVVQLFMEVSDSGLQWWLITLIALLFCCLLVVAFVILWVRLFGKRNSGPCSTKLKYLDCANLEQLASNPVLPSKPTPSLIAVNEDAISRTLPYEDDCWNSESDNKSTAKLISQSSVSGSSGISTSSDSSA